MDTPGYDPVSATGQVAGGANVLCFTTGRGSAYGCKPTPSLKLATNSDLFTRMEEDMDINCGDIIDGVSIEEKGREIFQSILKPPQASARNPNCSDTAATSSYPGSWARRCDSYAGFADKKACVPAEANLHRAMNIPKARLWHLLPRASAKNLRQDTPLSKCWSTTQASHPIPGLHTQHPVG